MYLYPLFDFTSKEALNLYVQFGAPEMVVSEGPQVFSIPTLTMSIVHCAFAVFILAKAQIVIKKSKIFFMLQGFVGLFTDPFLNK